MNPAILKSLLKTFGIEINPDDFMKKFQDLADAIMELKDAQLRIEKKLDKALGNGKGGCPKCGFFHPPDGMCIEVRQ